MSVLTIVINDPSFEKKSSEVAYLRRVLELASQEIGRGQGLTTTGNIVGTDYLGRANQSLGSWIYMPSGSKP